MNPAYDSEYTMLLNDQLGGFTINGTGFPASAPLSAKLGQKLRIRYMNEGMLIHPMHLHGLPQLVFAATARAAAVPAAGMVARRRPRRAPARVAPGAAQAPHGTGRQSCAAARSALHMRAGGRTDAPARDRARRAGTSAATGAAWRRLRRAGRGSAGPLGSWWATWGGWRRHGCRIGVTRCATPIWQTDRKYPRWLT